MKYKGKELIEMLPENWDGKSRNMLVWCDDTKPIHRMVCGYDPIHCVWLVAETQAVWKHCAEIPIVAEEDVMKLLNDNEKEILELKAENDELKAKIKSLRVERGEMANAVSGAVWKELMDRANQYNGAIRLPAGLGFNDISDIVLNKIIDYKSEKKLRRMTYKELNDWLEQGKGVVRIGDKVRDTISHDCESRNQEVSGYYKICGYDEDTWHYPMIEAQ